VLRQQKGLIKLYILFTLIKQKPFARKEDYGDHMSLQPYNHGHFVKLFKGKYGYMTNLQQMAKDFITLACPG